MALQNKIRFSTMTVNGEECYYVEHIPSGCKAVFDLNDNIVEAIKGYMELHRKSLTRKHGENVLFFPTSPDGTSSIRLHAFIYGLYHGIPIDEVRMVRVSHTHWTFLPGSDHIEDCRSINLSASGQLIQKNRNREFSFLEIQAGMQVVCLTVGGITDYMDYIGPLLDILMEQHRFTYCRGSASRLQVRLNRSPDGIRTHSPYFSQIIGAYHNGMIDLEHFEESVLEAQAYFDKYDLDVDHLLSDTHNHCKYNLSIMSGEVNRSKKSRAGAFAFPYNLYGAVTPGGQYLLEWYPPNATMGEAEPIYYRCTNENNLNTWLKAFFGKNGLLADATIGMSGIAVPTPKQLNPDVRPLERDFIKDCIHAKNILSLYAAAPQMFSTSPNWNRPNGEEFGNRLAQMFHGMR